MATEANDQGQVFSDDYSQPDAIDGEPVFWSDGTGQPFLAGYFAQADLSACTAKPDVLEVI